MENNQLKCPKCGKNYRRESAFKIHIEKCDFNSDRPNKQSRSEKNKQVHLSNGVLFHPIEGYENIKVNGKKILFDKEEVKEVIKHSAGSVHFLAKAYGVSYPTIHKFIHEHSDLVELLEKQQHLVIDKASDNIYNAVLEGNIEISKWILTHLPTKFRERMEVANDIKIQVITNNPNIDKL